MEDLEIQEKISELPEYLKKQVLDYIDFLIHKYKETGFGKEVSNSNESYPKP